MLVRRGIKKTVLISHFGTFVGRFRSDGAVALAMKGLKYKQRQPEFFTNASIIQYSTFRHDRAYYVKSVYRSDPS